MKTNLLFALRNIAKNKLNTVIAISGLSVAFASLFLIYLYVAQEFSYNDFQKNRDLIYRISYNLKYADGTRESSVLLDPKLPEILKEKIPQIEKSTAFRSAHDPSMIFRKRYFKENTYIAGPDFFDIFSFRLILGNKKKLLKNPNEIVITASLADKLSAVASCTRSDLIGKPVFFMNTGNQPFIISGIMEDIPQNSSMRFDALIPYKHQNAFNQSNNLFGNSTIFYKIQKKSDVTIAREQVAKVLQEYYHTRIDNGRSQKILANTPNCFLPSSSSFTQEYLENISSDYEQSNNKTSLYILLSIGLLILIIAGSNLIVLSLGQSFKRLKEISVRRTLGAKRKHIFSLYLSENIIICVIAITLGILLGWALIPLFNRLAENEIYTNLISVTRILRFVIVSIISVVVLISILPTFRLLKISPNRVFNRKNSPESGLKTTRIFVTLQYGLSILLIILTITIIRQTHYMKYRNLGFSSKNIIDLPVYHLNNSEKIALRDKLKDCPEIANFTLTDRNYISGQSMEFIKNSQGENVEVRTLQVDANYIPTLGLKIVQGKNFEETNDNKKELSIIVNQKLLSLFDYSSGAIGQTIRLYGINFRIIGVVKDYHFDSMKEEIEPLILIPGTSSGRRANFIFIRYKSAQLDKLIPFLKQTWGEIAPGKDPDLGFWDKQLEQRYGAEEKWSRIIGFSAIIAILVSSLGLFGLSLLVTNRRIKEIGIRKVNGARTSEILSMLNSDLVKWIIIAFFLACPIAWYAMHRWLQNFAYKTSLSWWIFALAGSLALGIALLTVSFHSWKAATRNPVEALRYE